MSDFVFLVRRVSLAFAIAALAAGASWADEPAQTGDDAGLEAPQIEENQGPGDNQGPSDNSGPSDTSGPDSGPVIDTTWIPVGNPPDNNPPAGGINVDDQGNPLVTPEPASLVLLTTGAAGTVIARWRKRGR